MRLCGDERVLDIGQERKNIIYFKLVFHTARLALNYYPLTFLLHRRDVTYRMKLNGGVSPRPGRGEAIHTD